MKNVNCLYIYVILGALCLFLGMGNNLIDSPLLVLGYPLCLFFISNKVSQGKKAFYYGWLCGILGSSLAMYWLYYPVYMYGGFPLFLALPVPVCMGLYIGLYGGLFSYLMYRARVLSEIKQVFCAFLFWFILELFRSWFGTGFTWLSLSSALVSWPILVQSANIIGMFGLSALYVLIVCALVQKNYSIKFFGIVLFLVNIGYGYWQLNQEIISTSTRNFLLVQGNISQDIKWETQMQQKTLNTYLELAKNGILAEKNKGKKVDIVLFPETAMPFFLQDKPLFQKKLESFAQKHQVTLLFGGVSYGEIREEIHNSLFLIKAHDSTVEKYSKQHLVPFGEYVPEFLNLEILGSLLANIGGFTPSNEEKILVGGNEEKIGVLICYEAIFPNLAQKSVTLGAEVLVNVSNDGWYGTTAAPKQHLQLTALRAIEQKRYIARSTNTGITSFISPYGEILAQSPWFVANTLAYEVKLLQGKTIYQYIQGYINILMSLLFLFVFYILFVRKFFKENKLEEKCYKLLN